MDASATMLAVPAAGRPGGRVVSGGADGRVLVWDVAAPGAGPLELSRRNRAVEALAVLADGRGWSAAELTGGCWSGTRPSRGRVRSSRAATTAQ